MSTEKIYRYFIESTGVSIDSRSIKEGQIFFALKGENFDGHNYVDKALDEGACLAVIDDDSFSKQKTILVDNCLEALQKLGSYHRDKFNIPVLAITGSNGKTTTKELIYTVLSKQFKVHATKGNFNNHIGVPLTLLSAPQNTEIMIVEMGANHIGEIQDLCSIANPNYGLITNIGKAHLEGFGSYAGVIKAKTELYRYLADHEGTIIFNSEDELLVKQIPEGVNMISYPQDIRFDISDLSLSFKKVGSKKIYKTELYGAFNSNNILAAIAIGQLFKVDDQRAWEAISGYQPKMNRSQILQLKNTTLILDAYNANPSSVKLSLKSFFELDSEKDKKIVLGDMKELGDDEIQLHIEILESLNNFNAENVFLVGELFNLADKTNSFHKFNHVNELIELTKKNSSVFEGALVLIKASRSIQLEKLSEHLSNQSHS